MLPLPLKVPEIVEATKLSRLIVVLALTAVIAPPKLVGLRSVRNGWADSGPTTPATVKVTSPICSVPFGADVYGALTSVRARSMSWKLLVVGWMPDAKAPGSRR